MLALLAGCLAVGIAQEPSPPSTELEARVQQLEQDVLTRDAEIVRLKVDGANCQATAEESRRRLQSLQLSAEVLALVERYKKAFGGDWTYDEKTHQIVAVGPKEDK